MVKLDPLAVCRGFNQVALDEIDLAVAFIQNFIRHHHCTDVERVFAPAALCRTGVGHQGFDIGKFEHLVGGVQIGCFFALEVFENMGGTDNEQLAVMKEERPGTDGVVHIAFFSMNITTDFLSMQHNP